MRQLKRDSVAARVRLARDDKAGGYLEVFLVFGVAAILVIRAFLALTGYPQLGGGGLHIAHMLWGGLLMLAAIVLLLAFLGSGAKLGASILGGIGFGTFIDELGKFITSDNNYFFKPTIALIYIIFIILFFLFRAFARQLRLSPTESLANAAETIVDALIGGASRREITRTLDLLARSGSIGGVADVLREAILATPRVEEAPPSLATKIGVAARHGYERVVSSTWFQAGIIALFVAHAISFVGLAVATILGTRNVDWLTNSKITVAEFGALAGSLASSAAVVIGALRLAYSRLEAYHWFKRSILISIFFVQVFLFYEHQLTAIGGLAVNLVLLGVLNYMIGQELENRGTA